MWWKADALSYVLRAGIQAVPIGSASPRHRDTEKMLLEADTGIVRESLRIRLQRRQIGFDFLFHLAFPGSVVSPHNDRPVPTLVHFLTHE
jgi:hypothetical protein